MRKQLLLFITMLACACGILRAASYNLVTSADQLNDTDEFIFVSGQPIGDSYYVVTSMTTSGGSSTAISNLTSLETTIEISDNINPLIFQFKDVTATATNVTKKGIYDATNGKYIGRKTASMLNLSSRHYIPRRRQLETGSSKCYNQFLHIHLCKKFQT